MNARDDYLKHLCDLGGWHRMCDEMETLRAEVEFLRGLRALSTPLRR